MNILLYDIGSYIQKDLIYFLKKSGCHCRNVIYKQPENNLYQDDFFEKKFREQLERSSFDFVMSTNFSPIVARLCCQINMKYVAWIYDSPINTDHMEYYQFPTSYIFLFDRHEVERIRALGGVNIYHMPLAVNPERIRKITISEDDLAAYSADISFVGNFYGGILPQLLAPQSEYDTGFIDAIAASQLQVYGYNFIEDMLSDDLIVRMNKCLEDQGYTVTGLTKRSLSHNIATSVTHTERLVLLSMLGRSHYVRYYSSEKPEVLSHLIYGGMVSYFTQMPKVFHLSRLNLCPTLKAIRSGIPLRALDIMVSGGALLCNYQPELSEYFTDGLDVIMYESIPDALSKAEYYLTHEDKRLRLSQNGCQKVISHFSYPEKISAMLKTAGIL